jgi:hypothetical protein
MMGLRRERFFRAFVAVITFFFYAASCQAQPPNAPDEKNEAPRQPARRGRSKSTSSPLQRAITRGLQPNGDLGKELSDLDDYTLSSREDAQAVCKALETLPSKQTNKDFSSPLHHLTDFFQDVENREVPAFEVLSKEGIPQLIRIFDAEVAQADTDDEKADDLLFLLKILAMYQTREGAEKVVEAAKRPLKPDDYTWHVVLKIFSKGHPHSEYLFKSLSDPLPEKFLAVSLVDSANTAAREDNLKRHPFDSEAGHKRLQSWIEGRNPDHFSYAHSAAATLPFIANPARDQLLDLAMNHPDADVQIEAAWAAAKLGREVGFEVLVKFCKDVNHSDSAQRYLAELGREDLVSAEAKDPSFAAKAEFAQWLSHPSELGQPPDEIEIVDHRKLAWPPEREPKPFWLIRYRLRDKTGLAEDDVDCGLVGSMTWCFFSYNMDQRPPEDVYAIHCYWEMENDGSIDEEEVDAGSEYAVMIRQWKGPRLVSPKVTMVAKISADLKTPATLVGVATAKLDGKEGWAVLDGPRSKWYPKDEQPKDSRDGTLLKIHVGRQLLGFRDEPDRKKYLAAQASPRDPRQIVEAYEKLLADGLNADAEQQGRVLSRHFNAYVDALVAVKGTPKSDAIVDVYGRYLKLAQGADASVREETFDSLGLLGEHLDEYVDALVSRGRTSEISGLITTLDPYWQNNLGYRRLGSAAFKAGEKDIAERYLSKLREDQEYFFRFEEMGLLADIWHVRGATDQARELLIDCMKKLLAEIKESKYPSDRTMFAKEFQNHRSTFLRLFPDKESDLSDLKLPSELE